MDNIKLKQIKRQHKLNQLINHVIKENTEKIKLERKFSEISEKSSFKHESADSSSNTKKYENQMPFILLGLIESVFNDERSSKQVKEYGCGLLIENNIVIVPAKNLVYETDKNVLEQEKINNFKLYEVYFTPFNLSKKYRQFLPTKIRVKHHFTYLNQLAKVNYPDEANILNSWGLAVLDFPLGDFFKYVKDDEEACDKRRNFFGNNGIPERNSSCISSNTSQLVEVKPIDNIDLFNSVIFFLESKAKAKNLSVINNLSLNEDGDQYSFSENFYDIKFDENLIFLRNLSNVDGNLNSQILPGIILSYTDRKYFLIGMNTNIIIKIDDEGGSSKVVYHTNISKKNMCNENEEVAYEEHELTHRIGVRFNKEILTSIAEKIEEIKSIPDMLPVSFSGKLFRIFERNLTSVEILFNHLRDNCKTLIELIKEIKNDTRLKLSKEEKEMLTFKYQNQGSNNLTENQKENNQNFIYLSLSLIWNKLSRCVSNSYNTTINLSSLNIGLHPGSEIIAEMLKNSHNLKSLNLNSNQFFSGGIKYLIKPIFNTNTLNFFGKDLEYIHLDNNKLSSKSLKYLRHLLKATASLKSLTLNHNYIAGEGLKYLINSMKGKDRLTNLEISFNVLGNKSGKYLHEILKSLLNLKVLDLQSNSLSDSPIPFILSALQGSKTIQALYLGNNYITKISAEYVANYLFNNRNMLRLWLNDNPLSSDGVGIIGKSLMCCENFYEENSGEIQDEYESNSKIKNRSNFPALKEINLANVNAGCEGAQIFFNFIKKNRNINRIIFHSNNIGDIGCINIAEYLSTQTRRHHPEEKFNRELDEFGNNYVDNKESAIDSNGKMDKGLVYLSLSNNNIGDDGAKILSEQILRHNFLKEIKLNSNSITDLGAELLLYSILCNNSIEKFHLENNKTTWRDKNIDVKNTRSNIKIFF